MLLLLSVFAADPTCAQSRGSGPVSRLANSAGGAVGSIGRSAALPSPRVVLGAATSALTTTARRTTGISNRLIRVIRTDPARGLAAMPGFTQTLAARTIIPQPTTPPVLTPRALSDTPTSQAPLGASQRIDVNIIAGGSTASQRAAVKAAGSSPRIGASGRDMPGCMSAWDPKTHVEKSRWREICARTLTSPHI